MNLLFACHYKEILSFFALKFEKYAAFIHNFSPDIQSERQTVLFQDDAPHFVRLQLDPN